MTRISDENQRMTNSSKYRARQLIKNSRHEVESDGWPAIPDLNRLGCSFTRYHNTIATTPNKKVGAERRFRRYKGYKRFPSVGATGIPPRIRSSKNLVGGTANSQTTTNETAATPMSMRKRSMIFSRVILVSDGDI